MATGSSDELVLDCIDRTGLGCRELLKVHLGGTDPNNILQRLMGKGRVKAVARGLPQNRSYYVTGNPLGPQALHQKLAYAWHVALTKERVVLRPSELAELFGLQAPPGVHVFERSKTPRVFHVYVPETIEIVVALTKHVERARTFPQVRAAMKEERYGFLTLLPWGAAKLEAQLRHACESRDLVGVDASCIAQARRLLGLNALLTFARAPDPQSLSLALKESL